MRSRRCARSRSGSPAGSSSARASRRRSSTSSPAGTDVASPTSRGDEIPAADAAPARRAGHLALPLRRRPRRSARRPRTSNGCRVRASPRASSRCGNFDELLADLDETRMWEQALEIEPFPQLWIGDERVDAAFMAIAALTGLKSPWLREHSTAVAELAEAAAWRLGLPPASVTLVRRAALAHDLGRVGVSNAIWEKPGAARLRRVGARAAASALHGARVRAVARARPDRRPRRLAPRAARRLRLPPRHARGRRSTRRLGSSRRPTATARCASRVRTGRALDAGAAEAELLREAGDGRLDPDAVDAVLAAAGHRVRQRPRDLPSGLTERELEILLVLVRGKSNQEIADDLEHLCQDRREPRSARLREDRRAQPRRGDALGLRARPRSRRVGRSPHSARAPRRRTLAARRRRPEMPSSEQGGEQ